MKYLVTGGAGFIGSNFIHYIFGKYPDAEIINLDKLTYAGSLDNLKDVENNPRYKFVQGDIVDPKVVEDLVRQADTIVHFAAETHVDRSITGPAEFVKTNVVGTQVLLDAAIKHKKRFHHISTDEVFGQLKLGSKDKFTESTPYDPSSPYSASKAASDHLVRAYVRTFGLQATITNCSNNYGPYQYSEKFIPTVILNALKDQKIPVYGQGRNVRDWIHVDDHNRAVDLVINKGKIGETYLIGADNERANIDVVKMILRLLGKPESLVEFVADRPGHDLRYAIDSSKIRQELGWKSLLEFEEGLRQTIKWYQDHA
ncbi:MAG: dTDP-glucose 4,6-dehydratase [Candidatus Doudnabacteria bacterium RIFCSPLOWO2_02_FULL_49_13]|uniref:dTDP-glucose 4,6-dehydratase n=1 Tax=Candidatus Doudnabacteria bacterium RIFCSPHIGHO2_12_FULL_48_16 TaxID=1817838 RepID=A0A1F5PLS9_9BACT|nr:MAG: dTDP-glucose 4,6-dehydratase [Candidatus Doudnabacteria bacterium RIFCSPHIGHO2_02_FULL_49_24]OGE88850.1 MAG: dTDP-glucose 4,6-dehydratase [Candidatus Doudnabacteria bacterium RIFCSPHIGHO2_01_FULL_50_67]OGE90630.1 MAG: dTDP-glucose 4,6-dehydratase [Candidatus Doudnabacteria bacterium RIFCSPHIGHO2_12_FULL_48_16]OGE96961.1 MAG: dTDP-glucose 4,6-dehydratase [Candidatus Doudnabacteria bacterium RIFCSPLOWO2_01_FULL_49_40]OGF02495.1 MAG: dTDP-glucose 4,6-dehydratase [Candidatus Doudnabacteria 